MSKLSFRARALDASRPLAVWLAEELPELPDYSAISRAVPPMPSGMEKEEECEHHLQRAICTGLIIPTPEVSDAADLDFYERCYPPDYKMPRQLIHVQPLCLEQETPEYDMDSEDERWLRRQHYAELTELKFEEMMERLERSSGQTVVTLHEAKLLLERRDDLVIAVYDYWLNKRLKTQHPLILSVRTESRTGQPANNPYLAFRRRTEKMQTRKNRKNDESSYEKMLKLRRDLSRAASLLELVARRERAKRDLVRLTALLADKRFHAGDFAGHLLAEVAAVAPVRSAPTYGAVSAGGAGGYRRERTFAATHYAPRAPAAPPDTARQRDKRHYKRRKHRHHGASSTLALRDAGAYSSSEEEAAAAAAAAAGGAREARGEERREDAAAAPPADDGPFAFRRKAGVYYQMPTSSLCGDASDGSESPSSYKENLHTSDKRFRFTLTSISHPYPKCVGFARRRLGRGGRVILDRVGTPLDDLWPHLEYPHERRKAPPAAAADRRHRYPAESSGDYGGGAHPWRRAYRRHRRRRTDCDPAARDSKLNSGDISCSEVEGSPRVRKRRRRRSDSSLDSAAELEPDEAEFGRLLDQVNTEWLHFRPKTPAEPPRSPPRSPDAPALAADAPLAVELLGGDGEPFTTGEFTLGELYGDALLEEADGDDFAGLTDAQVESILSDADLEAIADDDIKYGRKNSIDLLRPDEADAILEEVPFLLLGQGPGDGRAGAAASSDPGPRRRRSDDGFGCSVVTVAPIASGRVPAEAVPPPPPPPPPEPAPAPAAAAPASKPPPPPPPPPRDEVLEEVRLPQGVQLRTVHARHSPLKKHIIRRGGDGQEPQVVTVAVSEGLKARLQSHLLAGQAASLEGGGGGGGVVGVLQNGPYATVTVPAVSREGGASSSSSPRRVSAPLVHLTPALQQKPVVVSHALHQLGSPPVVVSHVPPSKLKVLHTLTQSQRTQLLAQSRAAGVALAPAPAPALQLKGAPVAQFYEIKGGALGRGPHVLNVLRQPQPGRAAAAVARLELADGKRRAPAQVAGAAGGAQAAPRPQRVSVLDGRQLVRASLPAVRAQQVRHQIQLKSRALVAGAGAPPRPPLAGSVVASLLQKNAVAKAGQKIAIAGGGGSGPLANVQAFAAFTHAQQLKARQARLVTQARPNATADLVEAPSGSGAPSAAGGSLEAAPAGDGATNGSPAVRRRAAETLPMEVT